MGELPVMKICCFYILEIRFEHYNVMLEVAAHDRYHVLTPSISPPVAKQCQWFSREQTDLSHGQSRTASNKRRQHDHWILWGAMSIGRYRLASPSNAYQFVLSIVPPFIISELAGGSVGTIPGATDQDNSSQFMCKLLQDTKLPAVSSISRVSSSYAH